MTSECNRPNGGGGCALAFLKENPGIIVIAAAYLVLPLLFSPVRDIPFVDDWAYAKSAWGLAETGILSPSDWTSPSFVFQAYYGTVFTKLFGESFTVLRVSTILLSFLGSIAFQRILKRFCVGEFLATATVLLVVFNPVYFEFLYTFMTDVPYVSLTLISFFFFMKGFDEEKRLFILLGSIAALCAFLTRQLGLFIPVGVFVYMVFARGSCGNRKRRADYIAALAPFAIGFICYMAWYRSGGSTWAQRNMAMAGSLEQFKEPLRFIVELGRRGFYMAEYAGLFSLPLLVVYYLGLKGGAEVTPAPPLPKRLLIIALIIWAVIIAAVALNEEGHMPYLTGYLMYYRYTGDGFWGWVTLLSSIGTAGLLAMLTIKGRNYFSSGEPGFRSFSLAILVYFILQAGLTLFHEHVIEQYMLVWLPFVLLFVVSLIKERPIRAAAKAFIIILIVFSAFYSISNTKFRHNAAEVEWEAGNWLLTKGVPITEIYLRFEWNGLHQFDTIMEEILKTRPEETLDQHSTFRVMKERARFASSIEPGRFTVKALPVPIPWETQLLSRIFTGKLIDRDRGIYIVARTKKDYLRVKE